MSKLEVKKNHTNNKRAEYHGVTLGHSKGAPEEDKAVFSGKDNRVKPRETTRPGAGLSVSSQAPSEAGASPSRIRAVNPAVNHGGTHVQNVPKSEAGPTPQEVDAAKMALFTRGGSGNADAVPQPGPAGE